jgi:dienelactone hydrolase
MLEEYEETTFEYDGRTRKLYDRGEGPGIVVMHEIPGIYDAVVEVAERLKAA